MAAGDVLYWELNNFGEVIWEVVPTTWHAADETDDAGPVDSAEYWGAAGKSLYFPPGTFQGVDDYGYPVGFEPVFWEFDSVEYSGTGVGLHYAAYTDRVPGTPDDYSDVSIPSTYSEWEELWTTEDHTSINKLEYDANGAPIGAMSLFKLLADNEVGVGMMTIEDGDEFSDSYVYSIEDMDYARLGFPFYKLYFASTEADNPYFYDVSESYDSYKFESNVQHQISVSMDSDELDGLKELYSSDASLDITQFSAWSTISEVVVNETTYAPTAKKIKNLQEITFDGLEGEAATEKVSVDATSIPTTVGTSY